MDADAADLLAALGARGWSLGTAESLTGGLLAATVVEVPGASATFAGSVVAYDPAVKISLAVAGAVVLVVVVRKVIA